MLYHQLIFFETTLKIEGIKEEVWIKRQVETLINGNLTSKYLKKIFVYGNKVSRKNETNGIC